jgi:hypothetical protein
MDAPLYVYPLVAVAPLALHGSSLLGSLLLARVRTGFPPFDHVYNRWPWLLSVLCGVCLVAALALKSLSQRLAIAFVGAALLSFVLDVIGMAVSFCKWIQLRR